MIIDEFRDDEEDINIDGEWCREELVDEEALACDSKPDPDKKLEGDEELT